MGHLREPEASEMEVFKEDDSERPKLILGLQGQMKAVLKSDKITDKGFGSALNYSATSQQDDSDTGVKETRGQRRVSLLV